MPQLSFYCVKVQGLPGTYIVNQYRMFGQHPQTLITFNQGGYWSPIVAPDMDAHGHPTNCNMVSDSDVFLFFT